MDENLKHLIKYNAFYGHKIIIDENMGYLKCPTMNDLQENILLYIYLVNKYIELYEDNKNEFYEEVFLKEEYFREFISVFSFFVQIEEIQIKDDKLFINEKNYIDKNNIKLFMEILRVLHHYDKKDDDYKKSKMVEEHMKRARKLKKELEAKIKNKDGVGFLEISSTVCARHPSINPTNIGQLNYYQIVEQFKRLMKIDTYTPCLYGNATEEYIKKNNVKHYSAKIINE